MKKNKILYFLMSLMPMLGSPRVSYGDLKAVSTKTNLKKEDLKLDNKKENSETEKVEDKNNIKKKKVKLKLIINKRNST